MTSLRIGDEVLFHSDDRWLPATVEKIRPHDVLTLNHDDGVSVANHGAHIHGWLTYAEAAKYARDHATA